MEILPENKSFCFKFSAANHTKMIYVLVILLEANAEVVHLLQSG